MDITYNEKYILSVRKQSYHEVHHHVLQENAVVKVVQSHKQFQERDSFLRTSLEQDQTSEKAEEDYITHVIDTLVPTTVRNTTNHHTK